MIYKFEKVSSDLELKNFNDEELELRIINPESDECIIYLDKKDVYHLIGALHLLHKEMK